MHLKNKNTAYSIRRLFRKYFLILLICTSGVLLFFCTMFIQTNSRQITYQTNTAANYYKYSLENEMDNAMQFGQKLCYSDLSFKMLTLANISGSDKVQYLYQVNQALERQVAPYESIFVFNRNRSVSTSAFGSSILINDSQYTYSLKENLRAYWLGSNAPKFNKWILFQDQHHSVMMAAQSFNHVFICTVIDLDRFDFLNYNNSKYMDFGFFNNHRVLSNSKVLNKLHLNLEDLKKEKRNSFFQNHNVKTVLIGGTDIHMFCIFHTDNMWSYTRITVILLILLAIITCLLLVYILYHLNRIVIYPLDQINAATKHLEQNDSSYFVNGADTNIVEYQNINHALANLIDQKISLTHKKQAEAFAKDHARLQYYQLQTSSHFLINCLKSLFHMLENSEYEKMQCMIIAFSNHLRYVFHDNLKFVTLEAELAEVNDYYNMIMLDRITPIILNQDIDASLFHYGVPSLIIQTFLENTSKYNKQSDNLLLFDIQITRSELEGSPVMQLQISDNGVGYSKEMLDQLNSSENDLFAKEHVGISNLKHRIALIYKTNFQFAFYNKPKGGACALIYLPLLEHPRNH